MSGQQRARLHLSLVAGCALIAIALLATFYSVVSGAVSHAAERRLAKSPAAFVRAISGPPSLIKNRSFLAAGAVDRRRFRSVASAS